MLPGHAFTHVYTHTQTYIPHAAHAYIHTYIAYTRALYTDAYMNTYVHTHKHIHTQRPCMIVSVNNTLLWPSAAVGIHLQVINFHSQHKGAGLWMGENRRLARQTTCSSTWHTRANIHTQILEKSTHAHLCTWTNISDDSKALCWLHSVLGYLAFLNTRNLLCISSSS